MRKKLDYETYLKLEEEFEYIEEIREYDQYIMVVAWHLNCLCKKDGEIILCVHPNDGFAEYSFPRDLYKILDEYNNMEEDYSKLGIERLELQEDGSVDVIFKENKNE